MRFNKTILKACLVILCLVPSGAVGSPQFDGATFFMENEIWKDIVGYDGRYQISNSGKVKSLPGFRKKPGLMNLSKNIRSGYSVFGVRKDGITKQLTVHRQVALAFIPNPLNLPEVNHEDGIKTNNWDWNLKWCTTQENADHAVKMGLTPSGHNNYGSKLTPEQIIEIRTTYKKGQRGGNCIASEFSSRGLAEKYGVCHTIIQKIVNLKSYK